MTSYFHWFHQWRSLKRKDRKPRLIQKVKKINLCFESDCKAKSGSWKAEEKHWRVDTRGRSLNSLQILNSNVCIYIFIRNYNYTGNTWLAPLYGYKSGIRIYQEIETKALRGVWEALLQL